MTFEALGRRPRCLRHSTRNSTYKGNYRGRVLRSGRRPGRPAWRRAKKNAGQDQTGSHQKPRSRDLTQKEPCGNNGDQRGDVHEKSQTDGTHLGQEPVEEDNGQRRRENPPPGHYCGRDRNPAPGRIKEAPSRKEGFPRSKWPNPPRGNRECSARFSSIFDAPEAKSSQLFVSSIRHSRKSLTLSPPFGRGCVWSARAYYAPPPLFATSPGKTPSTNVPVLNGREY